MMEGRRDRRPHGASAAREMWVLSPTLSQFMLN